MNRIDLEARIATAYLRLQTASTPDKRREAFRELRDLVASRSPQAVRRMERMRGLAQ